MAYASAPAPLQAYQLTLRTLLSCQLFIWTYAYNSYLLALWFLSKQLSCYPAGTVGSWMLLGALLGIYTIPLILLYHNEASRRTVFAVRHVEGADARRVRARVTADPFAPMDLLLPAAILICSCFP